MRYTIVKYDFETSSWIALMEDEPLIHASGTTPDEAVENLRYQCNKHELWPK